MESAINERELLGLELDGHKLKRIRTNTNGNGGGQMYAGHDAVNRDDVYL